MNKNNIKTEDAKEFLEKFYKFCNKIGIKPFLFWGTLLGCIRDNNLIPWDDDIDLMVTYPEIIKLLSKTDNLYGLNIKINELKFNVVNRPFVLRLEYKNIPIDIDVIHDENDEQFICREIYAGKDKKTYLPKKFIYPLKQINFLGTKVYVPP